MNDFWTAYIGSRPRPALRGDPVGARSYQRAVERFKIAGDERARLFSPPIGVPRCTQRHDIADIAEIYEIGLGILELLTQVFQAALEKLASVSG